MGAGALHPLWVANPSAVVDVCLRARGAGVIAVDTEADSFHSYFHKLCLVQLSFDGENALLDPLALGRDALQPFAELLADPGVEKVLHGADYDLRVLHRDLGARVVRLHDTQMAAQLLGEGQTGLAALLEKELGIRLDKQFQRADWGQRPLPDELLAYAAGDTAFLESLRSRLGARLEALGRHAWWEEECAALESVRWEAPVADLLAFERIKGARRLKGEARDRLAALYSWREAMAADADLPPFRILQGEALLALALDPPADLDQLSQRPRIGKSTVRRFGREIVRLFAETPPAPPRPPLQRMAVDRAKERRLREARDVRDEVAVELGVASGVLTPRAALEQVAERLPADEDALRACLGRAWRTAVLAPRLLPLVASWRSGGEPHDAEPPR